MLNIDNGEKPWNRKTYTTISVWAFQTRQSEVSVKQNKKTNKSKGHDVPIQWTKSYTGLSVCQTITHKEDVSAENLNCLCRRNITIHFSHSVVWVPSNVNAKHVFNFFHINYLLNFGFTSPQVFKFIEPRIKYY